MFVYSLRASTLKFVGIICLSVIVLIALIAFIPTYEPTSLLVKDEKIVYDKITGNEERIEFISQFGWDVNPEPIEEVGGDRTVDLRCGLYELQYHTEITRAQS